MPHLRHDSPGFFGEQPPSGVVPGMPSLAGDAGVQAVRPPAAHPAQVQAPAANLRRRRRRNTVETRGKLLAQTKGGGETRGWR